MSQSNFSYEDFILSQVHSSLKKVNYISSSWERVIEKSSSWKCFIYNNHQEFICTITMNFKTNFDKTKLIPIELDVIVDSPDKKMNEDNDWDEVVPLRDLNIDNDGFDNISNNQNNNYQYIGSYDLNHKESLKFLNRKIINLLTRSKSSFWTKYIN